MATTKTKKKMSQIEAAAKVLAASRKAMTCQEMVDAMTAKRLWKSPGGKTPHATVYSAMIREIAAKGKQSRFKKAGRGRFTANT